MALAIAPAMVADAAPCSATSASSCTITTSTTIAPGTLGVAGAPSLYWSFVQTGYDQVASASASALSGCAASSATTTCTNGASTPMLQVVDARGGNSGWALSAYVTGVDLPAGTTLAFNGAGTTIGTSASGSSVTATAPSTRCDSGSSCTLPTAATSCAHSGLGFTSCPVYNTDLLANATSDTRQVDLYSASGGTGLGAICFGASAPSGVGCQGSAAGSFFNLGMKAGSATGTYSGAVITLTASTGP